MPWFKVDDGLHAHRKPRRAGLAAMGLWTVAGSWSAGQVQEGFVPLWFVEGWKAKRHATHLVDAGLWYVGEKDGEPGWYFHDWEHFQPSKTEIDRERQVNRERQRKFRQKRIEARLKVVNDE
jgi:hypothetical protein